jgi:hypothetical protein
MKINNNILWLIIAAATVGGIVTIWQIVNYSPIYSVAEVYKADLKYTGKTIRILGFVGDVSEESESKSFGQSMFDAIVEGISGINFDNVFVRIEDIDGRMFVLCSFSDDHEKKLARALYRGDPVAIEGKCGMMEEGKVRLNSCKIRKNFRVGKTDLRERQSTTEVNSATRTQESPSRPYYGDIIRDYLKAEDSRDFDAVYKFFSPNLEKYWNLSQPSYETLKKAYERSWSSTLNSSNHILKTETVSENIYNVEVEYTFTLKKTYETKTTHSKIRFEFDKDGKITATYGIEMLAMESTPIQQELPSQLSSSSSLSETYKIIEELFGDLNKDGLDDKVQIVKGIDRSKIEKDEAGNEKDLNRRGVIISFRKGDSYELALKNISCFSSENEGGGVLRCQIVKGTVRFYDEHRRYYCTYVFRYQNNDFELIGYEFVSLKRSHAIENGKSVNFSTRKMLTRRNRNENPDDDSEKDIESKWEDFTMPSLYKLSKIADIDALAIPD